MRITNIVPGVYQSTAPCSTAGNDVSAQAPRSAARLQRRRAWRALIAAALLSIGVRRPAHAQTLGIGRIEGTVTDSAHARPLAGIRVVVAGVGARADVRDSATTDSVGRFRFDPLRIGRYVVGIESPLLDSLEIAPAQREVVVGPGGTTSVQLATPSGATLRAAVCPHVTLPTGTGAIYGHVVNADTENPLDSVTIVLSWRELGVDRTTLRPTSSTRTVSVVTDASGWYVACGVPTGAWVEMQPQRDDQAGTLIRTFVDDTLGVAIRHLSFSPSESASEPPSQSPTDSRSASRADADAGHARADAQQAVARTGTATLRGTVLGPANEPVPRAEVHVRGAATETRTDSSGRYSLGQLPAGTQILDVRRFGYEVVQIEVELRRGAVMTKDVRLQRVVATLDTMRSIAIASQYPEFVQHSHSAYRGYFFGPEELEKMHPTFTSDIIQRVPAMRVEGRGPQAKISARRGANFTCPPNVVVNDVEGWSFSDVNPKDIGAVEVYPGTTPPSIASPWLYDKGCGAILIWTKRSMPKRRAPSSH